MKNKSENNEIAARYLTDKKFLDSAVHCFYYSSFQLIQLFIEEYLELDSKQIKEKLIIINDQKKKNKEIPIGSHVFSISLAAKELRERYDKKGGIYLSYDFSKLKTLRTKADYSKEKITKAEIQEADTLSNRINTMLKQIL